MKKHREWTKRLREAVIGRHPRRTILRAAAAGLVTFLILRYLVLPVRIRGTSMEPTFHDGRYQLVNLLAYRNEEPQRGDVVVIEMAGRKALYLKRIIGLPGEHIAFSNGTALINGSAYREPYLVDAGNWTIPGTTLGSGEYYVAGDNRTMPWETHVLGRVDRRKIAGSILFPPKRASSGSHR